MFVAVNHLIVKPGYGAEVERRFGARSGVERQPGFVRFELWRLRTQEDHEEYLVVTHWESEEDHANWVKSEAFRRAHAGGRPDFFLGSHLSFYDVRLSAGPAQAP